MTKSEQQTIADDYFKAFFGNGTRFGGVLSADQELNDEQEDQIRDRIESLWAKAMSMVVEIR